MRRQARACRRVEYPPSSSRVGPDNRETDLADVATVLLVTSDVGTQLAISRSTLCGIAVGNVAHSVRSG